MQQPHSKAMTQSIFHQGVYLITHRTKGKTYVGMSKNIHARWARHIDSVKKVLRGGKSNQFLHYKMAEEGIENFCFDILEEVPDESQLRQREFHWIVELKSDNPHLGYNTVGGIACERRALTKHKEAQRG